MKRCGKHARHDGLEDRRQWARALASLCASGCFAFTPPGGATCPTDLDGDSHVNARDLVILLSQWGTDGAGDIDGDGVVGGADLPWIFATWGGCWEAEDGDGAG